MKSLRILPIATLLTVGAVFSSTSVQAFTPFNFTTQYSPDSSSLSFDPTRDIRLDSVMFGGNTVNNFTLVTSASQANNSHSLGPVSSDHGDNTVGDVSLSEGPLNEMPTNSDLVASLGNLNLNSILDTEDNAAGTSINVFFSQPTNHLFFFERGGNSSLTVDLLDTNGLLLGTSYAIAQSLWNATGFSIDTTEIAGAQPVVSFGLKHSDSIAGVRLTAHAGSNGPDFKVVGANVRDIPTPSLLLGLGLMAMKTLKRRPIEA
jgi:hypothetical protein